MSKMKLKEKSKSGCENKKKPNSVKPTLKPGNKPYAYFGNEVLNHNVPWNEVVQEIIEQDISCASIAEEIGVECSVVENLLHSKTEGLTFRAGARLIMIHCRHYPHCH